MQALGKVENVKNENSTGNCRATFNPRYGWGSDYIIGYVMSGMWDWVVELFCLCWKFYILLFDEESMN